MRISIPQFWQSATVKIPPGEYEMTDPRLNGMGEHLVRTGQAEVLPEAEPANEAAPRRRRRRKGGET